MTTWRNDFRRLIANRILDLCVLRPSQHPIEAEGLHRVEILHPDSKVRTEAYIFSTLNSDLDRDSHHEACRHLVIKFPGTGGRAERSSEAPLNLLYPNLVNQTHSPGEHIETWTWNPPGYGRSSGKATLQTQSDYALDFAKSVMARSAGPETMVWLAGNSLGCLTALRLAATLDAWLPDSFPRRNLGCWLRNPPDLAPVILRIARRYRGEWFMKHVVAHLPLPLDAVANAAKIQLPAVFLASENDSLVPLAVQATMHDAYAGDRRVVVLEGLEHDGLIEEKHVPEVRDAMDWLANQASPAKRLS